MSSSVSNPRPVQTAAAAAAARARTSGLELRYGIPVQRSGTAATVELSGDLDLATAARLRDLFADLIRAGLRQITVDLSAVRFLDSSTLRCFLGAERQLRHRGGRLRLRNPAEPVRRTLRVTRTDHLLVD